MADDDLEKVAGVVLGIIGGIALLELLSRVSGHKCPRCGSELMDGQVHCFKCGFQVKKQ